MPRFSLILGTVGRTDDLRQILASLDAQTFRDFELIVVDQNPDDRLGPILAPYEGRFPIARLRSEKGLSRAKNAGLGYATGEIIGFPDDNCRYPPGLLAKAARFFADNPRVDGLTGRSVGSEDGLRRFGRFDRRPGIIGKPNVWNRGVAYNIFVRRGSIGEVRFDEGLGPGAGTVWGAGDETDFLLRLMEGGARLYYDPDLIAMHPDPVPPYDTGARRRAYLYGRGVVEVMKRHRYPAWFKARWLVKPLAAAAIALARLQPAKARYHWSTLLGRLRSF